MHERLSSIRQQEELRNKSYFGSNATVLLPFFAAGYGFTDDMFDNLICHSYYTPGLVRFTYELLFSDEGQPSNALSHMDDLGPSLRQLFPVHHATARETRAMAQKALGGGDGSGSLNNSSNSSGRRRPAVAIGPSALAKRVQRIDDMSRASEAPTIPSSLSQMQVPNAFYGKTFGELFVHLITAEDTVALGLYRRAGMHGSLLPYVFTAPPTSTVLTLDDLVFTLAQPRA